MYVIVYEALDTKGKEVKIETFSDIQTLLNGPVDDTGLIETNMCVLINKLNVGRENQKFPHLIGTVVLAPREYTELSFK